MLSFQVIRFPFPRENSHSHRTEVYCIPMAIAESVISSARMTLRERAP